jgi:hypothetical protein
MAMENKTKKIWDYFEEKIEYSKDIAHNPIPYGTVWTNVSSTFLNGFINYVKPIACFIADRYTDPDTLIGNDLSVCNKGEFQKWHKWEGTKKELIAKISSGEKEVYHTKLNCFEDDVIVLAEIESEEGKKGRYMFFWFDRDVSDCSIGKFETSDKKEDVIESVINWLDETKNENYIFQENTESGIVNYKQIPADKLMKGWIKF